MRGRHLKRPGYYGEAKLYYPVVLLEGTQDAAYAEPEVSAKHIAMKGELRRSTMPDFMVLF